jgi:DNA/RNA endonuclease G (NUC1)
MERLTKEGVKNVGLKRSGTFRVDKYNHRDVEGYEERFSSYPELYERGHMANLANHPGSKVQMWSTFVYSNSTPMLPRFNRGLNNVLESFGRQLTHIGPVYVLTGGLDPSKQDNGIDIYGRFYKVFLVQTGDNVYDSYSWILPHEVYFDIDCFLILYF